MNRDSGRVLAWLNCPVSSASFVVLRAGMGLIVAAEIWRYFHHGWIDRYWVEPEFHFKYAGFGWVQPLPGIGMHVLFAVMFGAAMAMLFRQSARWGATTVALLFSYQFLLEQARYLNHFYAAISILWLIAVVSWVVHGNECSVPGRSAWVPRWAIVMLRFQVGVIYLFAGMAKMNGDWLTGAAWREWLVARYWQPAVRMLLDSGMERVFFGYGGLIIDIALVPLLLCRRTRAVGLGIAAIFHYVNAQLFSIGIFPWMMMLATLAFLPPAWPTTFESWIFSRSEPPPSRPDHGVLRPSATLGAVLLSLYMVFEIVVPLRHVLYPGDVRWTEEGHRFSWRMMSSDKRGTVSFRVVAGADTSRVLVPPFLAGWQAAMMPTRPDMILQAAHEIARRAESEVHTRVSVYADAWTSLNGRPLTRLIDPEVDLAAQPRSLRPSEWILDFQIPD